MADPQNRIAEWRKKRGMTQQQLADAIGAHWITVSKLERGKMQLTHEWAEKIADALRTIPLRLTYMSDRKTTVYIQSIVANGENRPLRSNQDIPLEIDTHQNYSITDYWSVVADYSLYPVFRPADVIMLQACLGIPDDPDHSYETNLGALCLIKPVDIDRQIIAILEPSEIPGFFSAKPLNGPPIKDFKIEVMAVVRQAFFGPRLNEALLDELEMELAEAEKHSHLAKLSLR